MTEPESSGIPLGDLLPGGHRRVDPLADTTSWDINMLSPRRTG